MSSDTVFYFSSDIMNFQHDPLPLTLLCEMCFVLPYLKKSLYDFPRMPRVLFDEIYVLIQIAEHKRFSIDRAVTIAEAITLMLEAGFRNYQNISKPHYVLKLFDDTARCMNTLDIVFDQTRTITDINEKFLIRILPRLNNVSILNNVMILSACFGKLKIFKTSIACGANDFVTARRAAFLFHKKNIVAHLIDATASEKCETIFSHTAEYMTYHDSISTHINIHSFLGNQITNERDIRRLLASPGFCIKQHIRSLRVCMPHWGFLNIFQMMASLDHHRLQDVGYDYFGPPVE